MLSGLPSPIGPFYWIESIHEPLLLYEGPIQFKSENQEEVRKGQVHFQWLPKPGLQFWAGSENQEAGIRELFDPMIRQKREVSLMELDEVLSRLPVPSQSSLRLQDFPSNSRGHLPPVTHGKESGLRQVIFNVINFSDIIGTAVTRTGNSTSRNRLTLRWDSWEVVLDARAALRETVGELRETGGFAFTHVGCLSRSYTNGFDWKDAEFVIDGLWIFLSFSRGALVAPSLSTGLDSDKRVQLIDWRTYLVSPWRGVITWLDPTDGTNLEAAFAGFMDRWSDDFWRDVLLRSIRIYVQANHPDPLETAIIMAQTALELLAWAVLVEQEQWLKEGEAKLPAAARLRLLLRWASIPTDIPEKLEALAKLGQGRTPKWDGPTAVAEVRNALVHPKKADGLREAQVMADVWMLALWYLELVILRVIGYNKVYSNRLRDRWAGDVDPVPWVSSPAPNSEGEQQSS